MRPDGVRWTKFEAYAKVDGSRRADRRAESREAVFRDGDDNGAKLGEEELRTMIGEL